MHMNLQRRIRLFGGRRPDTKQTNRRRQVSPVAPLPPPGVVPPPPPPLAPPPIVDAAHPPPLPAVGTDPIPPPGSPYHAEVAQTVTLNQPAVNQLPGIAGGLPPDATGIDPGAFMARPAAETDETLDFNADFSQSDTPSKSNRTGVNKATKADTAAGIVVLLIVAGLALWAIIRHRCRRNRERQAQAATNNARIVPVDPVVTEGVEPPAATATVGGGQGTFRIKREMDMQQVGGVGRGIAGPPHIGYGGMQKQQQRNELRKAHPGGYSKRQTLGMTASQTSESRSVQQAAHVLPPLSAAKERYYFREQNRGKLSKAGPSSRGGS
ncbi:hypothetical protein H072_8925 [Dactylellina haptotyla CBS 200.50]|uniref:Transmembrane protein n=1 Tax=Dactylellina haptotyla (strain CBS 200.50) TaxID=1284197 RepID=S8A3V9_DACHA|nr:hypothetical protein H072_8925 [Dactylellina haptotyla CBS 200.50]